MFSMDDTFNTDLNISPIMMDFCLAVLNIPPNFILGTSSITFSKSNALVFLFLCFHFLWVVLSIVVPVLRSTSW